MENSNRNYENPQGNYTRTSKIDIKEMLGYGLGDFGYILSWTLVSAFLTFFYTDVAGISAGLVGTLMILVRVWDGISDVGMGFIVDRTTSKHGKARPYLIWMPIPLAITLLLLFTVPDISDGGKFAYAAITYSLFILMYTAVTIPYKTLLGQMTQDQQSRSFLGVIGAVFIQVSAFIVTVFTEPVANAIGGQRGWVITATLYGIVTITTLFITFISTKERVDESSVNNNKQIKSTLILDIKLLFKNRYWLIMTVYCIVYYLLMGLVGAELYYATYIIGNTSFFSLISIVKYGPAIIALLLTGFYIKRYGKRNTALLGTVLLMISAAVKIIIPTSAILFLIGSMIYGVAKGLFVATIYSMINDTVDYGEWKTGKRIGGLVNSGASFGMKVGTGIGTALIGWLLAFGGYVPNAAQQSVLTIQMIYTLNIYIPFILGVCCFILLLAYKLDKIYPQIINDLNK